MLICEIKELIYVSREEESWIELLLADGRRVKEFPRCANWQHFGPHEYVTALEPVNGTVNGRAADRAAGLLENLAAGARKSYRYCIEVVSTKEGIEGLRKLNG